MPLAFVGAPLRLRTTPLADVAPAEVHPEIGASYATLWAAYDRADRDRLRRLDAPAWLQLPGA